MSAAAKIRERIALLTEAQSVAVGPLRWALDLVEAQEAETTRLMGLLVDMQTSDAGFTREDWYRICELSCREDAKDYVEDCAADALEQAVAERGSHESE